MLGVFWVGLGFWVLLFVFFPGRGAQLEEILVFQQPADF